MLTNADRVPLANRAWIADGRSGALVAADGTIDWYCPGRFDGPAALSRILDPSGGAVRIGPVRDGTGVARHLPASTQRYVERTMVAVTELPAGGARLRIVDAMPWGGASVSPPRRIVRLVTALAGPVDVELEVLPGSRPEAVSAWSEGVATDGFVVRGGFALEPAPVGRDRPRWRGVRRLDPGESLVVTIDDVRAEGVDPLAPDAARRMLDDTVTAWRSWLAPLALAGAHGAAVERSALLVRSLTGPAGGPMAAGTTSLPRRAGGERTADDRVVHLRDAATAAGTLARAGLAEDAEASERWLREAVQGADLPWPVALAADGSPAAEREELGLAGWRRSQPVVAGVDSGRVDLDLFGDVLSAASASQRGPWGGAGDGPLAGAGPALAAAADWVADHWSAPDAGVWGCSGRPARLVASAAQAWVALDRAARRAVAANPLDLDAAGWRAGAREVLAWLEAEAVAPDGGLVRDDSGADRPDAALLRVAWQGPWPRRHPVVVATVDRILDRLGTGAFVHRLPDDVDDGRPGPDSPDLLASLWAVRALAALQRWDEAHERLEAVTALGGSLGILSEAVDPLAGELLGNLPCTAVHLAVIDAAASLETGPA